MSSLLIPLSQQIVSDFNAPYDTTVSNHTNVQPVDIGIEFTVSADTYISRILFAPQGPGLSSFIGAQAAIYNANTEAMLVSTTLTSVGQLGGTSGQFSTPFHAIAGNTYIAVVRAGRFYNAVLPGGAASWTDVFDTYVNPKPFDTVYPDTSRFNFNAFWLAEAGYTQDSATFKATHFPKTPLFNASVTSAVSGGSIAGNTTLYYKVTAIVGGVETLPSAEISRKTFSLNSPSTFNCANGGAASGSWPFGSYTFAISTLGATGDVDSAVLGPGTSVILSNGAKVTFSWSAVAGASGYRVYLISAPANPVAGVGSAPVPSHYLDFGAGVTSGEWSDPFIWSPGTPTSSNSTYSNTNKHTINWNAISGATGYRIYKSSTSNSEAAYLTTGAGVTTIDDTGIAGTAGSPPTTSTVSSLTRNTSNAYGEIGFDAYYINVDYITEPIEPSITAISNQFRIGLPANAIPPDLIEWDLQYSTSTDNSVFGNWVDLVTLPNIVTVFDHNSIKLPITGLDGITTTTYYRYRYRLRTKTEESLWSEIGWAGEPRLGSTGVTEATATETGTIQLSGDLSGTAVAPVVADRAITGSKIALNTIADENISPAANIDVTKLNVDVLNRANHTGTQLSSTVSDFDTQIENIFVQSVAANIWTIPYPTGWRGNRRPAVTIVDSAGTVVVGNITYNADNTITVSFDPAGAQFSGKAYLN